MPQEPRPESMAVRAGGSGSGCVEYPEPAGRSGAAEEQTDDGPQLRSRHHRAEVAGGLAGAEDLPDAQPARRARGPPQVLRPRHVPLPVRAPACTSATPRATPPPTSSPATSACTASTCCTRWAGTPSACPPSSTPSREPAAPARSPPRRNIATFRRQIKTPRLQLRLGPRGRHHRPGLLPLDAVDLPASSSSAASPTWRRCRSTGARRSAPCSPTRRSTTASTSSPATPSSAGRCASGCCASPPTPSACSTTSTALDWPESVKEMQRNWIGTLRRRRGRLPPSTAATTTLHGLHHAARHAVRRDLLVLAPEHPLVDADHHAGAARRRCDAYVAAAAAQARARAHATPPRTRPASSPARTRSTRSTASSIPIWIADYVLDRLRHRRHHGRARPRRARLRVRRRASACRSSRSCRGGAAPSTATAYAGDGPAGQLAASSTASTSPTAKAQHDRLARGARQSARARVHYQLRDWLFSRQRYWGEPFPIVHARRRRRSCRCPTTELPVALPALDDYQPDRRRASRRSRAPATTG